MIELMNAAALGVVCLGLVALGAYAVETVVRGIRERMRDDARNG